MATNEATQAAWKKISNAINEAQSVDCNAGVVLTILADIVAEMTVKITATSGSPFIVLAVLQEYARKLGYHMQVLQTGVPVDPKELN